MAKIINGDNVATFQRPFKFKENLNEIIAKNVIKYRKLAGITQEQLAVDIGTSHEYQRRYESTLGQEGIALIKLYRISVVLNVSIDKFFEE